MKTTPIALILTAGLTLAGCAGMSRTLSYGNGAGEADVKVGRAGYDLLVHPTDMTVMVQEHFGGAMGGALFEGLSFGMADTSPPLNVSRAAAAAYLGLFDCRVTDAYPLDDITTEVAFACDTDRRPEDVEYDICVPASAAQADWQVAGTIEVHPCD